jgi:hypothetical protein
VPVAFKTLIATGADVASPIGIHGDTPFYALPLDEGHLGISNSGI